MYIQTGDQRKSWAKLRQSPLQIRSRLMERDDLVTENSVEERLPVTTRAEGVEYTTHIIWIKLLPKPIFSYTAHKNDHSSLSKAFLASRESTAAGASLSITASIMSHNVWRFYESSLIATDQSGHVFLNSTYTSGIIPANAGLLLICYKRISEKCSLALTWEARRRMGLEPWKQSLVLLVLKYCWALF